MTISAALVFVIIAFILVRSGRSTVTTALVCALAGFLLASTGLAPTINDFLTSTGTARSRLIRPVVAATPPAPDQALAAGRGAEKPPQSHLDLPASPPGSTAMATTDQYAEFALPTHDAGPAPAPGLILPPGFACAIDPATGQVVAVRIQEQPLPFLTAQPQPAPDPPLRELTALENALLYAAAHPDPVAATVPPPAQGVSPVVGQVVVLGGMTSLAMLVTGGAIDIACAGLHTAGPWFHDAAEFLQAAAVFIVAAVAAAVVAVRKLKAAMATQTAGDGTVVNALIRRHTEVTIGRQSGGFWKGRIHNSVR